MTDQEDRKQSDAVAKLRANYVEQNPELDEFDPLLEHSDQGRYRLPRWLLFLIIPMMAISLSAIAFAVQPTGGPANEAGVVNIPPPISIDGRSELPQQPTVAIPEDPWPATPFATSVPIPPTPTGVGLPAGFPSN